MDAVASGGGPAGEGRGRRPVAAAEVLGDPVHQVTLACVVRHHREPDAPLPANRNLRGLRRVLGTVRDMQGSLGVPAGVRRWESRCTPTDERSLAALVIVLRWPCPVAAAASNPLGLPRSMWIWYVSRTDGGSVRGDRRRCARARDRDADDQERRRQHRTGRSSARSLVRGLHAARVHVCAWQYVYGNNPAAEARVGARGGPQRAPTA